MKLVAACMVCSLAAAVAIPELCNIRTVDPTLMEPSACSSSSVCGSLQAALLLPFSGCVEIRVPSGTHAISAPAYFTQSTRLIGTGDLVRVECSYSSATALWPALNYTLNFYHTAFAALENVQFVGCPAPLRFDGVSELNISNCAFRNFTEASLDIYNCQQVALSNCTIEHNKGTGNVPVPFRGNTGGVAIGINSIFANFTAAPSVHIANCTFAHNQALVSSISLKTISQTSSKQVFTGRGGALGLFINDSVHNITMIIADSIFHDNYAKSFGGGIYVYINGRTIQHHISIERSAFVDNFAEEHGGGGVLVSFYSNGLPLAPHTVEFVDCRFEGNMGEAGGGLYVFTSFYGTDGNYFKLEHCNFTGNTGLGSNSDYGAAFTVGLFTPFRERVTIPRHEVIDCLFLNNNGQNGIISIGYAPMRFMGHNRFIGNQGSALRIIGSLVELLGDMYFANNTVKGDSAALQLLSFAQVRLHHGLNMTFENNVGKFGASIIVGSHALLSAITDVIFNPLCFALYENSSIPPIEWDDVDITFRNNRGLLGSVLYLSDLNSCSWYSLSSPSFSDSSILQWPIWHLIDNLNTGYENSSDTRYSIQTTVARLETPATEVHAWPGQQFELHLVAFDNLGQPTTANPRFGLANESTGVQFTPDIVVIDSDDTNDGHLRDVFTFVYGTVDMTEQTTQPNNTLDQVLIQIPSISTNSIKFYREKCPGGYVMNTTSTGLATCICDSNNRILLCEDDQINVIIEQGYWTWFAPSKSGSNLYFHPCPSGYCQCHKNTSLGNSTCAYQYSTAYPDIQCVPERKGVLCGQCRDGRGVSALSSHCVSCSDASAVLIPVLMAMVVIAVTILLLVDKPLPIWIHPLLFYIQMVPYVAQYFPESFDHIGQYGFYISSGLNLYYIYDFCLYSNMSAVVSYFIRFLPLLVTLVISPTVFVMRRMFCKRWRSAQHYGLWWITLLLYSHIIHSSLSVLNCTSLPDERGTTIARWFVSGDVECFQDEHLGIALLAIVALLLCVLLIPLVFAIATNALTKPSWIQSVIVPISAPFKTNMHWWCSVELGRRLVFLLLTTHLPRIALLPALILVTILTVYGFAQPYKSRFANNLEIIVDINFVLLLFIWNTGFFQEEYVTFSSLRSGSIIQPGAIATITWILAPFFYLPYALLIIIPVASAAWSLYGHIRRSRTLSFTAGQGSESFSRSIVPGTTIIVNDIDGTLSSSHHEVVM